MHVAVLEGIVENNHVDSGVEAHQLAYAEHAVFTHGYHHIASELVIYLV